MGFARIRALARWREVKYKSAPMVANRKSWSSLVSTPNLAPRGTCALQIPSREGHRRRPLAPPQHGGAAWQGGPRLQEVPGTSQARLLASMAHNEPMIRCFAQVHSTSVLAPLLGTGGLRSPVALGIMAKECGETAHVLQTVPKARPNQACSLQGSRDVSCDILAANDLGIGSGWQQSKQNWALLAVVGT